MRQHKRGGGLCSWSARVQRHIPAFHLFVCGNPALMKVISATNAYAAELGSQKPG